MLFYFSQTSDVLYAEKDDFDQRLECAAPKRWSKYTTNTPYANEIQDSAVGEYGRGDIYRHYKDPLKVP